MRITATPDTWTRARAIFVSARRDREGAPAIVSRCFSVDPQEAAERRYELGLTPRDPDDDTPVGVIVSLYEQPCVDGGTQGPPLLSQRARVSFERERTIVLVLPFTLRCVGVTCSSRDDCPAVWCDPDAGRASCGVTCQDDGNGGSACVCVQRGRLPDYTPYDAGDGPRADSPRMDAPEEARVEGRDGDDVDDRGHIDVASDLGEGSVAADVEDGGVADGAMDAPPSMDTVEVASDVQDASVVDDFTEEGMDVLSERSNAPTGVDLVVCGEGGVMCGDACVRLDTRENCGACGRQCVAFCEDGGCNDPVEIAAGGYNACARLANGSVWCWGANGNFQLGNADAGVEMAGGQVFSRVPVRVGGILGAHQIAVGDPHVCARTASGVRCWGRGNEGQLGSGANPTRTAIPQQVVGLGAVEEICAAGSYACARTNVSSGGTLYCWGSIPAIAPARNAPQMILPGVSRVFCGDVAAFALMVAGVPYAWGVNGTVGNGATPPGVNQSPDRVPALAPFVHFSSAGTHTCGIDGSGRIACWGSSTSTVLGLTTPSPTPFQPGPTIDVLSNAVQTSGGSAFHCARLANGQVWCWGVGDNGVLGDGMSSSSGRPPVQVSGLSEARQIASGSHHTCALRSDSVVLCWGANTYGTLGNGVLGSFVPRPVQVAWDRAIP